ncbi:MAG TPA: branched-chain amino acid ABC transporter permease [Ramlibacter sp.]|nr:branched-chain amino acid ABC transporter permease [Ramlibacter sp.]
MGTALIGLALAMILFLLAAGVTIIFGVLGVINFAHAAYFTLGAFIAFLASSTLGSFWLAFPIALVVAGAIGALQEVLTFRPIYNHPHSLQLIASLGFSTLILAAIHFIWGIDYRNIPTPALFSGSIAFMGSELSSYRLFVIALGLAACFLLNWAIEHTRWGILIKAASSNSNMLACLGINVRRLRTVVLAAGSAVAALAGVVVAPLLAVQLDMGGSMLLDSFLVVVLAGLGSVKGAIVVSLILGMSAAFGQRFFPDWIQFATYSLALAFLMVRPSGLFGRKVRVA